MRKFEHIEFTDNGMVHYDSGLNQFTQEEADRLNEEYYSHENSFIPQIIKDGYIEFPILYDNGPEPIWSNCYLPPTFEPSCTPGFEDKHGLRYNIYIPSYKRAGIALTNKMLDRFGIDNYYFCVDPSQYPLYKEKYGIDKVIVRDPSFKSESKLDLTNSVISPDYLHGASGVFNALLYISKSLGEKAYFTMDDDISSLGIKARKGKGVEPGEIYDKDNYYRCSTLTPEIGYDFKSNLNDMMILFDKMRNKSFMSCEKYGLVFALPVSIKLGTRSYSFYLTDNAIQRDHLGQQNNDIITSLEMSKYGYVNAIIEGIPQYNSVDTQILAGGASDVYAKFGTLDKAKVLVQAQPNYSKVAVVYSRVHHFVDFNQYNKQRLLGAVKTSK
ncbi:MAG TPA: hypothetical protein GXZ90_08640 [Clostridiales bacterium]|nr:hypothetical protein [Clostridiales bacterium]